MVGSWQGGRRKRRWWSRWRGYRCVVGVVVGATGVAKKDQVTEVAEEEGAVEGKARVTGAALVGPCPLGY